jgi:hypothetical protein
VFVAKDWHRAPVSLQRRGDFTEQPAARIEVLSLFVLGVVSVLAKAQCQGRARRDQKLTPPRRTRCHLKPDTLFVDNHLWPSHPCRDR